MLDNGYSLCRTEILNWGNFHGYQKFDLHEKSDDGPLFSPPPASAILGVNGSGKSTLIDAIMIALLPFEGSVKLGVTNDVEGGGGGGRTIRDYVLGKHSSSGGLHSPPESIYGRKGGCSLLVLHFKHNRIPDRVLTIGRAWWYQNHKVSETQVAFLAYHDINLKDLCPNELTPTTAKAFRQHLRESQQGVQVFDTMQAYFAAMSEALGRISRDDLKILNRAFFVKSISNIDSFIRDNMLIEQESPGLDRLMENVRSGNEIAFSIEVCEAKIGAITRILRDLVKLREKTIERRELDLRDRIFGLYGPWMELRKTVEQFKGLKKDIAHLESQVPLARRDAARAGDAFASAEARLREADIETRIQTIEREINALLEKIGWQTTVFEKWLSQAKLCDVRLPVTIHGWAHFISEIDQKISDSQFRAQDLIRKLEVQRESKFQIESQIRDLRAELEHVSQNRTLIPKDLHAIRDLAVQALKLPKSQLMFVGELLQVRVDYRNNRRAVESVLSPISRNLLCHPDALNAFTKWLDAQGLRKDVTAKRISITELNQSEDEDLDGNVHVGNTTSVLGMIEMKPANEHPFTKYLWRWLRDVFDYQLVDVRHFKQSGGKLVTKDGLVKKDERTMRKSKQAIPYSLGWENADVIERLALELKGLDLQHGMLMKAMVTSEGQLRIEEGTERFLVRVKEEYPSVASYDADLLRREEMDVEKKKLLTDNPDHLALRRDCERLEAKYTALQKVALSQESDLDSKNQLLLKISPLIPSRERELHESTLYQHVVAQVGSPENLTLALSELRETLERKALSTLQYQSGLLDEIRSNERVQKTAISTLSMALGAYRSKFNDPNLPYELSADTADDAERFLRDWGACEKRLRETDLPGAQEKWKSFFDRVLLDSVKDTINEIKKRIHETDETIRSINEVLKLTNFEDLIDEQRYLRIESKVSDDERVRRFRKSMGEVERTLGPSVRALIETQSQAIMAVLVPFVEEFHKDPAYRAYVTDVRNHFQFSVQSLRREAAGTDLVVETFEGARKDAKSSAQTTQLAYALLASCLAFRFKFHDPVLGGDTLRMIILDEFGGKFDNEKPREILRLLEKMGFQSILVSPMSKADLLADGISHLVLVHKANAVNSRVRSYKLTGREDYERLLAGVQR